MVPPTPSKQPLPWDVEKSVTEYLLNISQKTIGECLVWFFFFKLDSGLFIFPPNDSPSKNMKSAFYFIQKVLFIVVFGVFSFPFHTCQKDKWKWNNSWCHELACITCFATWKVTGQCSPDWCALSAWFFHKNVPYLILYQSTKFQCHTFFPFEDMKKCIINFLFRQLMTS